MSLILALDQGTTSSRAILFDRDFAVKGVGQIELPQHYPANGRVEHDPDDLFTTVITAARRAMAQADVNARDIAGIGITNQRETTLIWNRITGQPVHRAIVWQDRRMSRTFGELRTAGMERVVAEKTGLLLDPYFSANKISWLLEEIDGVRAAAERGELAFGTVDTWLLWRLTGGRVHATDATNASRTALLDLAGGKWDDDLLRLMSIPRALLPEVRDCAADFGLTDPAIFGGPIAVLGMAGDQQAATMGQACFEPGMMKATYGTGCFALLNTGRRAVGSKNRLLTTIASQFGGERSYALEGAIFVAGAAVQWLRDGLGIVATAAETGELARSADGSQDVILVPAFVGLGAPQWQPDARGAIFGLTRATTKRELARAALQAVAYQTRDLLAAMQQDGTVSGDTVLRVDGGMVASDYAMQFLADILAAPVDRPVVHETTALGAAWLAGWKAGFYPGKEGFAELWQRQTRFAPQMAAEERESRYAAWQRAVAAVIAQAGCN